jgi:hypothetical protein
VSGADFQNYVGIGAMMLMASVVALVLTILSFTFAAALRMRHRGNCPDAQALPGKVSPGRDAVLNF